MPGMGGWSRVWPWALIVLSVMGTIGCVGNRTYDAAILWVIVGLVAAGVLTRRRLRLVRLLRAELAARDAAVAARADAQNAAYLGGDPSGVYGEYRPNA